MHTPEKSTTPTNQGHQKRFGDFIPESPAKSFKQYSTPQPYQSKVWANVVHQGGRTPTGLRPRRSDEDMDLFRLDGPRTSNTPGRLPLSPSSPPYVSATPPRGGPQSTSSPSQQPLNFGIAPAQPCPLPTPPHSNLHRTQAPRFSLELGGSTDGRPTTPPTPAVSSQPPTPAKTSARMGRSPVPSPRHFSAYTTPPPPQIFTEESTPVDATNTELFPSPNHVPRASIATPHTCHLVIEPNRNPFSPFRGMPMMDDEHKVTSHAAIVAISQTIKSPSSPDTIVLHQGASRFQWTHTVPFGDAPEPIALHMDVNGVVWLATDLMDGLPYSVKEVHDTDDAKLRWELAALTLGSPFIVRYHGIFRETTPTSRFTLQTEYFPRGCLLEWYYRSEVPEADVWRILQDVFAGLRDLHKAGYAHNNLHVVNVFVHNLDTYRIGNFGACGSSESPDANMLSSAYGLGDYFADETSFSLDVYTFSQSLVYLMAAGEAVTIDELQQRGYSTELIEVLRALLAPPRSRPNAQMVTTMVGSPSAAEHEVILTYRRQLAFLKRQILLEKRRMQVDGSNEVDEEPSSPVVKHGGEKEELPSYLRQSVRHSMEIPKHHAINTLKELLCFKMPIETPAAPTALMASP